MLYARFSHQHQQISLWSALPATQHTDLSTLPLPVSSSLARPCSAPQLPAAVQTPSTGRPIFVSSCVNMFTAPTVSSYFAIKFVYGVSLDLLCTPFSLSYILFHIHSACTATTIYRWARFLACPIQIGFSDHLGQVHWSRQTRITWEETETIDRRYYGLVRSIFHLFINSRFPLPFQVARLNIVLTLDLPHISPISRQHMACIL